MPKRSFAIKHDEEESAMPLFEARTRASNFEFPLFGSYNHFGYALY